MRTGVADLPLHPGRCPKWLFPRMVKLSRAVSKIVVMEYGQGEFLRRLSNPFFFQSLGCIVGFDWHSSGLTTTLTGALKEAIVPEEFGMAVLGGKGRASMRTQQEIETTGEKFSFSEKTVEELKYSSRMAAKVDSAALQDGYQLYHHVFIVTEKKKWAVVQQGMNPASRYALRYHWLSESIASMVVEPHAAIASQAVAVSNVLNMVAKESDESRKASVDLVKEHPTHLRKFFTHTLYDYLGMPAGHWMNVREYERMLAGFNAAYETQPKDYEQLLSIKGVGPKTVRSLALLGKLMFGVDASWKDPPVFSWAHGGKDGIPYPVDRKTYDRSVEILNDAIWQAELGDKEKLGALNKLKGLVDSTSDVA